MFSKIIIILLFQNVINHVRSQLQEGDNCVLTNLLKGKCTDIRQCSTAIVQLKYNIKPQTCSFMGNNPIVCCAPSKSEEVCEKYGKELLSLNVPSIVGGKGAALGEYPHMAAIGFGTKENIQWKCGGSLISDKFVLTAAHCLRDPTGEAKFVRMGDIILVGNSSSRQDFEIIRKIPHPDYKQPLTYNDIALIELDKSVTFSYYVRPACLHQELETSDYMIATGWGLTQNAGNPSNKLLKVSLSLFNNKECNQVYKSSRRRLPNGILEDKMVCAGGRDEEVDTCQGDSGGPIQSYRSDVFLHSIIGVTSFGKACGISNVPSVYTKVAFYVPWIESIVWP